MRIQAIFSVTSLAAMLATSTTDAHHAGVMYERTRQVVLEGTIEEYRWTNPHTHISINVPAAGKTPSLAGQWDVEGAAINIMMRQGWNKLSFKAGDKITVVGYPVKDGSKSLSLNYAIDATGRRLWHDVSRSPGPDDPPAGK